jgi:hypothetical protein
MAFRFQLTCGSFLLMPRGPTAVALLPSNVKPYFRRDFFSSRFHFHQGRFFSVSPSPVRHGGLVCRFLKSLFRLSRMGEFDCLFYIFLCSLLDAISGTFRFLYHISLLSLLNMLLSRLFRMGESDYVDDNPMKKHFSGKDLSIFSFILRWNVRL